MDRFYTSPALFQQLWEEDTTACGTVRMNRIGLPRSIMGRHPEGLAQPRGSSVHRQKGPLLSLVWRDKRVVYVLSTAQGAEEEQVLRTVKVDGRWCRQAFPCPQPIRAYTDHMCGVDLADQYCQYYSFQRKTQKWNLKVFFRLLEIAKLNAFRLFTASPNHQPTAPGRKFNLQLAEELIAGFR